MKNNNEHYAKKPETGVKTAIISSLWTLGIAVAALCFFVAISVVVFPKTAVKCFDYLGAEDASYVVYQRRYERTKTNESLYNVLQVATTRKDYLRVEKYSKAMLEGMNFPEFADEVDKQTKAALGDKYNCYADSYESYVKRNLTIALYNINKKSEAKLMALDSLYSDAGELSVYIYCVNNDTSISDFDRTTEILRFYSRYDVWNRLEEMLAEVEPESFSDKYDKKVAMCQRIRIYEIQYYIYSAKGMTDEANAAQSQITALQNQILAL